MKIIKAIRGQSILVDDEDFEELSKYKWYVNSGYAARKRRHPDGTPEKTYHEYMHRSILGLEFGIRRAVDHINGDKLDNRRENIRECAQAENCRNRGRTKENKSGFKGVHWDATKRKWQATIRLGGKSKYLGRFDLPEDAHKAYCNAANQLHGEFANYG
jgi:hypothetical protein